MVKHCLCRVCMWVKSISSLVLFSAEGGGGVVGAHTVEFRIFNKMLAECGDAFL